MIKSILLAVDGSVYTDAQVKHCVKLAKAFQSTIQVLSVVDVRFFEWAISMGAEGFVPVIPSAIYKEETERILETKADAVLEKCSSIIQDEGIEFTSEKIHGPPADIICEKSYTVDLLVIGARGEFAKWKSTLGGATLQAVIRQCNKPIFITTKEFQTLSKLLVAYDGSNKSNKALQMAGFFAAKLDIPISVVSVDDKESIRQKHLEQAETYLKPYGLDLTLIGARGNPEKSIVKTAAEIKSDLIVMGAFGHNRLREAILGSTTEHVMRNSKVPLLLYK